MAKEQTKPDTKESATSAEPGAQPAAAPPTAPPATLPPVAHPVERPRRGPSARDIAEAIRLHGPSFSMAERQEIIRAASSLPAPESEAKPSPYDGHKRFAFRLTHGEVSVELQAYSELDARRQFNESVLHAAPSPRSVRCECLGEVKEESVAA